jgi:hypothetical protein
MSIVAWDRAPAELKRCSEWRNPPANIAAPSTSRIFPIIEPAIDAFHIVKASTQRGEGNDEFGGVPESGIKQPANTFTKVLRKLLSCATPLGQPGITLARKEFCVRSFKLSDG